MPERSPVGQAFYAGLVSIIVWAVVLLAAWFADRADGLLGHGPLPSGLDTRNAYYATLIAGGLGLLSGGVMAVGVRQGKYFTRQFAWVIYLLVAAPLLLLLLVPLQRFGAEPMWGLPAFLVGIPGRMIVAASLGGLILGAVDMRRILPGLAVDPPARPTPARVSSTSVRGLPGRFTSNAWRALSHMQEETQRFEHSQMGTEHLLLGLLRDPRSHASRAIVNLGAEPASIKRELESVIGRRGSLITGTTGMTRRCQRVIEQAARVARNSGERVVSTGHLLQSLVEQPEDVASQMLESAGVTATRVATELRHLGPESE